MADEPIIIVEDEALVVDAADAGGPRAHSEDERDLRAAEEVADAADAADIAAQEVALKEAEAAAAARTKPLVLARSLKFDDLKAYLAENFPGLDDYLKSYVTGALLFDLGASSSRRPRPSDCAATWQLRGTHLHPTGPTGTGPHRTPPDPSGPLRTLA
jgi:hypothetical protein